MIQPFRVAQLGRSQIKTAGRVIAKTLFDMHALQIPFQMQVAGSEIRDDRTQLGFLAGFLRRRPGHHQVALKQFRLRETHIREIATAPTWNIQLLDTQLASIHQGDIGIVATRMR